MPSKEKLNETIERLKNADLKGISLLKLDNIIRSKIGFIPYTLAHMKKGHPIYRARLNRNCEDGRPISFNSENEISYRSDLYNIKDYGRANILGQSMFYGSFDSDTIETTRITNFFEIDELRSLENTSEELYLTIGKWRIKEDFVVLEIVFNQESIEKNPDVKRSFENQLNNIRKYFPEKEEEIKLILEFYSDQFAKKVDRKRPDDYKISAHYTFDALISKSGLLSKFDGSDVEDIWGVVYPSVQTDFQGNNIALLPSAVERFLELEVVAMFGINTRNKHTIMDNTAIVTDFGPYNSRFQWEHQERMTEDEMNEIFLKK